MIVITMNTDSNDCTVRLREPLGKLQYMRLLSCSFYNYRYDLKKDVEILFT